MKLGDVTLLDAINDPALFAAWFKKRATWENWFVFLAVLFGLPVSVEQLVVYQQCTGRELPPSSPSNEAWLICGRRAGKSFILALVAIFLAAFRSYRQYLQPGERGTIMIIAADRRQARTIFRYVSGLLKGVPMLSRMIERETAEAFDLDNGVSIEIQAASFRSTRGYTLIAALLDEVAFWRSEDSANPDTEILAALRPAMATIPDAMLLCASSPYARRGVLWEAHQRHFGRDDDPVLVWQAPTRTMNPTIPQGVIDEAYERDHTSASAEYGAEFRTDVESFVSFEAVQACIDKGTFERQRRSGLRYYAFTDPSGGSSDSFTLAVAHRESDSLILDCLREAKPPFSPEAVIAEFAATCKSYGISRIFGDRYGGEFPRELFRNYGIVYELSIKSKSDLYVTLLSLLNSRRVELLDHRGLVAQLVGLERRTARSGRDSIDHAPGGHDDLANAVAGALALNFVVQPRLGMVIGVPQYGSGRGVQVDPRTLRPIEPDRPGVRWVTVKESDVPAARGP